MPQSPQSPNIHQATYRAVRHLAKQLEPISRLAEATETPNAIDPFDTIIELLKQLVGGVEQIRLRQEDLEARLGDGVVAKAIKGAATG